MDSNMVGSSYFPNYFSIDDILASQERIPCKIQADIPKMGKLNPAAEEKDLKAGLNFELPTWLVLECCTGHHPLLVPDLPKIYKEAYREILKADASAVDLSKFYLYFYELGAYVKRFDRRGEVHNILLHTYKSRFRQVLDLSESTNLDPSALNKLDMLERRLFKAGHDAKQKLNVWLIESGAAIEAANMVLNYKKRRRVDMETK